MKEIQLKYGCNPNQKPARVFASEGELPVDVLSGKPGYINFLDALNGYQMVRELKEATGLPAAASFKHVSPAGAAVGRPLTETLRKIYFVPETDALSPLAAAYARARGADRMCSFGDSIALSDVCDTSTAKLIAREVSDGVIAPGYEPEALAILRGKRKGAYNVIQIDPDYRPPEWERKMCYGIVFEQGRNSLRLGEDLLTHIPTKNREIPRAAKEDLLIGLITLKYTQSNSVCYVLNGQTIGVGAGQQSRIHCTRLAGDKADTWWLRQHPKVMALPFREGLPRPERDNAIDEYILEGGPADDWRALFSRCPEPLTADEKRDWARKLQGVSLGSDAFFPFGDNIERARRSGARYVAQPGGSIRDTDVIAACDRHDMVMCFTGIRLFHH